MSYSKDEESRALKKFLVYLSAFGDTFCSFVQSGLVATGDGGNNNSLTIASHGQPHLKLTDDTVKVLCTGILECGMTLASLTLKFHSISDVGASVIGNLVTSPTVGLRYLDLEGNDISTPSVLGISNSKLELLNLSSNPIGEKGGMELATFVQNNNNLTFLGVSCCDLNLKASIGLITSLHDNTRLGVLHMDKPLLNFSKQEETTDHLSRVLLDKTSGLRELSMKNHTFGDRGARLLSDALSRNEVLTRINLDSNKICDAGAEALASFLILQQRQKVANPHLRRNYIDSISLSHNNISDEGAISLAEAIRCNTSLKSVYLRGNVIGRAGLCAIAEAVYNNKNLEQLTLFGNSFEQTAGSMFYNVIKKYLPFRSTPLKLDIDVYIVDGIYMIADCQ